MATALLALEGVLKTETGDPIAEGIRLFRILAGNYRVVITSDLSQAETEHWLKAHMIIGYADVYDNRMFFEGQDLRSRQLDIAMAAGKVDIFIDPDADYCAEALSKGIPSMMFAAPRFIRRTRSVKPWEDLKSEVERQKLALLDAQTNQNKRYE